MRKLSFLLALTLLAGCKLDLLSLTPSSPAGKYHLDVARTAESIKNLAAADAQRTQDTPEEIQRRTEEQQKQTVAFLSGMTIDMTIKEDGTWEGFFGWGSSQSNATGTWEQKDEKLLLTTLQENGREATKKVDQAIYKDGDIYFNSQAADIKSAFILSRAST